MAISAYTTKMLWGRAAARCSMTGCGIELVLDATETDNPALVGEMAHIVAESPNGPRGDASLNPKERDFFDNLILLCRNHHREIDTQPEAWSVKRLKEIKATHENWVKEKFSSYDEQKQRNDETYARFVDQWTERGHLKEWKSWISGLLSHGRPAMHSDIMADLEKLPGWIQNRVWPNNYPSLEAAFMNFAKVLQDLLTTFSRHAQMPNKNAEWIYTDAFYKSDEYNEERYHSLLREYNHHVDLVQDLALELTRAGNMVCDEIRAHLLHNYFLDEGRLVVVSGPHEDLTYKQTVVQYSTEEKKSLSPYPGLPKFRVERSNRDMYYGKG